MKLVVGLGNPGTKYTFTRHNIGFLVLDNLVGSSVWTKEYNSLVYKESGVIYCKPQTYMNSSGYAISFFKNYYKIDNSEILVVYDDLYLKEGSFRFGINKNAGGHNGLKNIIEQLGSKDFLTLRIGIGPRERAESISNYVMEDLNKESKDILNNLFPILTEAIKNFTEGLSITELQNKFNK